VNDSLSRVLSLDPGHKKARMMRRMARLRLLPLLPPLLRLRWKIMLKMGWIK
jgi:hypothetical protein